MHGLRLNTQPAFTSQSVYFRRSTIPKIVQLQAEPVRQALEAALAILNTGVECHMLPRR